MRGNITTSIFNQYKYKSVNNQEKLITELGKKEENFKFKEEWLYEIFTVRPVTITLDRKMQLLDHCKLITKDSEINQDRFNFIASSFNRTQQSTIMDHKREVESFITSYKNKINYRISPKIYKQEVLNQWLYKFYHQLIYTKINMIEDNFATILTDPERPTSFDPVITDHEYYAKLILPFIYQIKTVNCLEGKGSPDLIISTYDLNRLGFLKGKPIKGDYIYADLKTGSAFVLEQVDGNENGERLLQFLKKFNSKIETYIIDISPVTKNYNKGDEQLYIKKLDFVKHCKKAVEGNKVIIIFDSNIPKIETDLYYQKLAEANDIDPEHLDQFKNLVDNYNAALLNNNELSDLLIDKKEQEEPYLPNSSNDKLLLPQKAALEVAREKVINLEIEEYIATSIKHQNPNPFKEIELIQFFSSDD